MAKMTQKSLKKTFFFSVLAKDWEDMKWAWTGMRRDAEIYMAYT